MPCSIPDHDDLDDAISRGYVRERIAAAEQALIELGLVEQLLRTHRLGEDDDFNMIHDMRSNLESRRDRLQEAVDIAMMTRDMRAPRRADPEMLARVTARGEAA